MHVKTSAIAIFIIAASMVFATAALSIVTPVLAVKDPDPARGGLDKADKNVHDNTPGGITGEQDKVFHEGLCQGGHSTTVVDEHGGCDGAELGLTDPGNSDDHRQDK
jgi:hypothetical protein